MKRNQLSAGILLSLLFTACGQDDKSQNSLIIKSAQDTKMDPSILQVGSFRDSLGAEKLKAEYIQTKQIKNEDPKFNYREFSGMLALDFNQPELHVQLAELHYENLKEYQRKGHKEMIEQFLDNLWQEITLLENFALSDDLKNRITAIHQKLQPLPMEDSLLTKEVLADARKTFQSGKAIHIYYPSNKPIEFKKSSTFYNAINAPTIYLRYVKSPHYFPANSRVVTSMAISKDGKEPELIPLNQGYEVCALPTGFLTSFYMTNTSELKPDTKIFIHVENYYANPSTSEKKSAIISNTLSIPVVYEK